MDRRAFIRTVAMGPLVAVGMSRAGAQEQRSGLAVLKIAERAKTSGRPLLPAEDLFRELEAVQREYNRLRSLQAEAMWHDFVGVEPTS